MATTKMPVERQKFWFQFVTTPTADTAGTTILLHFNNRRYLFGQVAEGTQRACIQRGIGLKKTRNIFLTGETKWAYNSGLLGMILTMADVQGEDEETGKRQRLYIHGGPKLRHTLACARRFIFRTGMPLTVHEKNLTNGIQPSVPDYSDENIDAWVISARRKRQRRESIPLPDGRSQSPNTVNREQALREKTVDDMFDSDWRIDRLVESAFKDVSLPAMVWVRDPRSKDLQATFVTRLEDAPHVSPDQRVRVRTPWPAALVSELPPADNLPSSVSTSYVVRGHPQRGIFDAGKAKSLGVPPGPLNGLLTKGQTITLENGTVVTPEDVLGTPDPGQGMAILDVPHEDYLDNLVEQLGRLRDAGVLNGVQAFNWILGRGVLNSEMFKEAVDQFSELKHIISSIDVGPNYLSIDSSAASSIRLSKVRPGCFLAPAYDNATLQAVSKLGISDLETAQRGLIIQLQPKFLVRTDEIPVYLDVGKIERNAIADTRDRLPPIGNSQIQETSEHDNVEITTLGTGSAVPSKYRNVSANLIKIPGFGYYLLDCGENTMGQLRRIYNPEQLENVLCDLRMIWISHLHADHHLGTVSVLQAHKQAVRRRRALGESVPHQLHLVSERNMADFLLDYSSVESVDCVLLRCLNSEISDVNDQPINIKETSLPIKKLLTTRVSHCHGAQAVSITFENGFKISYSGDCRPSGRFAEIGANSDVLIHEATFDDGMEGDAMAKKHCTIGEALGVAMAMKAKNVILTHFSQRYQKLPVLTNIKFPDQLEFEEGDDTEQPSGPLEDTSGPTEELTMGTPSSGLKSAAASGDLTNTSSSMLQKAAAEMNICVAFDLMRVKVSQIKDMHLYYPAIERLFEIEQEKNDAKREAKREINDAHTAKQSQPSRKEQKRDADKYEGINRSKRQAKSKSFVTPKNKQDGGLNGVPLVEQESNSGSKPSLLNSGSHASAAANMDVPTDAFP